MNIMIPQFQELLRHWRSTRRMSQLALATEAGISARHLCFLETGRSQPSRDMVRLLAQVLDIPFAEQNSLLIAAGYAPIYSARSLESPELAPFHRALGVMLAQQEPYPAFALDDGWNFRMRNEAAGRLFGGLRPYYDMPEALIGNAMHVLCHPKGFRPFMRNWEEFVGAFMQILHREAMLGLNQAAGKLRDELMKYPDMPDSFRMPDHSGKDEPMLSMRLSVGGRDLSFFVTMTTFAMPRDVTLQQIKIECFFPADDTTAAAARELAANPNISLMS